MAADRQQNAVLWDIVEECGDEAEFLWRLWEQALGSCRYNLQSTSGWVEERLLGALDGLRVGGVSAADQLLIPALAGDEPMRACAAACVLCLAADPAGIDALAAQWQQAEGSALSALRRGVELVADARLLGALRAKSAKAPPAARATLLEAYAFRRLDPGPLLAEAAESREPVLLRAALAVASRLPGRAPRQLVEQSLASPDASVWPTAVEAGLVLGIKGAWSLCRRLCAEPRPGSEALLPLTGALGGKPDHARLIAALSDTDLRKAALRAVGFCGTREAADACMELLRQGVEVKLAADALCAITGLDLEERKLIEPEAESADQEPVGFADDDLDAALNPAEEDALPRPIVDGVVAWWREHRARFAPGVRYLAGQPASRAVLLATLANAPMHRRGPLAIEVAVRTQGRWLQTRAFTRQQWQELQQLGSLSEDALRRSPIYGELSPL